MSYPYEPQEQTRQPSWGAYTRVIALISWVSFLGAVFAMPLLIWVDQVGIHDMGDMTLVFLLAWLLCMLPAALALLLGRRPSSPADVASSSDSGEAR